MEGRGREEGKSDIWRGREGRGGEGDGGGGGYKIPSVILLTLFISKKLRQIEKLWN